ncbi:fungal transcriptional regulatory protein [Ophiostoma piceae UAMH 11346]|uniref:Fungal transcriptional regulatory protein n=1 Tax=Ophiostoma piceae (strain UAMH 11346) TaxID=1262450 RepID=S3CZ54_OPHP1|nr:fungal transcriptional regulatory protein [Ophiostoma piceae UAMH 11346]
MSDEIRPKSITKVRKRAPKACLSCRARKVRCDVSQRGRPCMNCYLDSETCVVTGRASRLRKSQKPATAQPESGNIHTHTHSHAHAHTHGRQASPPSDADSPIRSTSINGSLRESQTPPPPHSEVLHDSPPLSFQDGPDNYTPPQKQQPQQQNQPDQQDRQSQQHRQERQEQRCGPDGEHQQEQPRHDTHGHGSSNNHHPRNQPYQPRFNSSNYHDEQNSSYITMGTHIMGMSMSGGGHIPWTSEQGLNMSADITYSYYPFLAISNLPGILPQDVNYLELQGCLRVPTRSVLDEFVQQFFLHVHPLLPLFNEGDFWELYCQQATGIGGSGDVPCGRLSLLVFQAMLFATCNFVSRNSIRALGFPSIRLARAALYRRAKLLFDFETESSPAAIAQASLLLSYWSPSTNPGTKNPNTGWLCTAIQQAKLAEAHHYSRMGVSGTATDKRRANALKRLWWCCIIRDRVMSLGVRRPIQITRAHFDLEANPPFCRADLADEVERSRVYNPGTKSCLIEITLHLAELCVVLTDILTLVFPQDDTPGWGREMAERDAGRVQQGKLELRRWYKDVTLKYPMFCGSNGPSSSQSKNGGTGREFYHDSVILYTNLMYMYYHSARVALCHHEILHIAVANAAAVAQARSSKGTKSMPQPVMYENCYELHDAASGVTESLKELIQLRLARWLPVSAVACTALPLFLHIVDVKLATSAAAAAAASTHSSVLTSKEDTRPVELSVSDQPGQTRPLTSSALKQHSLNVLIEAMKTYQPQYDGVDWVSETIRHIVNLAQLDGPAGAKSNMTEPCSNTAPSDWTDILASNPSWYVRLALTMDLALSKNRMPEERDFPASLRGMFSNSGFIPVLRLGYRGGDSDGPEGTRNPNMGSSQGGSNNTGSNASSSTSAQSNTRGIPEHRSSTAHAASTAPVPPATFVPPPTMSAPVATAGATETASVHEQSMADDRSSVPADPANPPPCAPSVAPAASVTSSDDASTIEVSNAVNLDDNFPNGFSTDSFMLPHQLAMSMSMAMGMADINEMELDMGMDMGFPSHLTASGIITQLPSSDGDASPRSGGDAPSTASADSPQNNAVHSMAPEHDNSMLDAYTFDSNSVGDAGTGMLDLNQNMGSGNGSGNGNGSSVNKPRQHTKADTGADEWMESSWNGAGMELRETDRDTAQVLLEALGEP